VLEIIGMFAGVTGGTENAIAQIDIPQDGILRGIDWDGYALFDADNETMDIELSFIATTQIISNDIRGRISGISAGVAVLTSVGINSVTLQKWIGGIELILSGGERLYLHSLATAGVTGNVRCNLHFDGGATVTRRSARR